MELCRFLALILTLIVRIQFTMAELFSSMAAQEAMIGTELEVLHLLQDMRQREAEKINAAKEYVKRLRQELRSGGVPTASHPVGAFQIIERHAVTWDSLEVSLSESSTEETVNILSEFKKNNRFPNDTDVTGAALAFNRLQKTYKIKAASIAIGQIPETRPTPVFTARESFIVGQKQAAANMYGSAQQWLRDASNKFDQEKVKSTNHVEMLDWLQFSGWHYNKNASKALEISRAIKKLNPTFGNVDENLRHYTAHIANLSAEEKTKMDELEPPFSDPGENGAYEALCRGELEVAKNQTLIQRCYYETYGNPFLLLQPIKTEVYHLNPDIYVLHDLLLESEMKQIRGVAQLHLARARVSSQKGGSVSDARISQTAFLNSSLSPGVLAADIRSGYATNLNASIAELLQANNYGIGGLYLPHLDAAMKQAMKVNGTMIQQPIGKTSFNGNFSAGGGNETMKNVSAHANFALYNGERIATLMYYLSDVEAGGATVFPLLNLTIYPEKGSAAFWWNLHKDGMTDTRTLHSGCPVLVGSKWVANKWFREFGQYRYRPCGLTKDSPDVIAIAPSMVPELVKPSNVSSDETFTNILVCPASLNGSTRSTGIAHLSFGFGISQ